MLTLWANITVIQTNIHNFFGGGGGHLITTPPPCCITLPHSTVLCNKMKHWESSLRKYTFFYMHCFQSGHGHSNSIAVYVSITSQSMFLQGKNRNFILWASVSLSIYLSVCMSINMSVHQTVNLSCG